MRSPLLIRLAFLSILQNWRHSFATMLAIAGGFAAVSLFDGFLEAIRDYNAERYVRKGMTGHVLLERKGADEHIFEDVWKYSIAPEAQEKILALLRKDPRVVARMRYLLVSGLASNGRNSAIFVGAGYEEENGKKIRGARWEWNTVAGRPLSFAPAGGGLMMGLGLARRLGCDFSLDGRILGDGSYRAEPSPIRCSSPNLQLSVTTEHAQINALSLPLIGVTDMQLREFNDKVLAMPLETAQRLFDTDRITRVMVLLRSPAEIPGFVRDFGEAAGAAGLDMQAVPWIDHPLAAMSKGGLEVLGVFRGLFLGVVAIIAAMGVANSMMKSINERIREIGSLRSFGFRRRDVVLLFSYEGLFLGLLSCGAGMLLTTILAFVLSHVGLSFKAGLASSPIPVSFSLAFSVWLTTLLALSAITFLASWAVSRRASRMVIADALRYTA